MRHTPNNGIPYLLRALFAALCALWLWMFFPPMGQLGLVLGISTFVPFLLALLIAQLVPWVWPRILIVLAAAQAYIVYHFPPAPSFGYGVGYTVVHVIQEELGQFFFLIRSGQLEEPFQTHLFLFALIAIYWLLNYASSHPKLWIFYNMLGILILAIIDGNTDVHPDGAAVVVCLLAFLVLGLSRYARLRLYFEQFRRPFIRYIGPLALIVSAASGIAWALPKAPAVWANPLKKVDSGSGNESGKEAGKNAQFIGYQESSSHLGGSFVMDNTPVLRVTSKVPVYLRGKVYSDYTGKGWTVDKSVYSPVQGGSVSTPANTTLNPAVSAKSVRQTIQVLNNRLKGDSVFGAYVISSLKSSESNPGPLQVNIQTGDVTGPWEKSGFKYKVVSKSVEDPASMLQSLPALQSSVAARKASFRQTLGAQDLQLPRELPSRVQRLTQRLVKGDTKEYQMVTDVENYLEGFQYQISGVPVPGRNQDYVDEFLFESQVGYCNNFSSAMAVMLRTIGIPTRWVTGFSDGEAAAESTDSSATTYVVRESDAHSWVEVYFPKYGWIPFDPTPGFSFPYLVNSTSSPAGSTTVPPASTPSKNQTDNTAPASSNSGVGGPPSIPPGNIGTGIAKVAAAIALVGILVMLIFRKRVLLRFYTWLWRQETPGALTKSMLRLVRLLKRRGWVKSESVTVRDLRLSAEHSGIPPKDVHRLTNTVERTWYGTDKPTVAEIRSAHRTWSRWLRWVLFGKPGNRRKGRHGRIDDKDVSK